MLYDLGLSGLALLVVMSLIFGVVAHALLGRHTNWMWLLGTAAYFLGGLIASEAVFGDFTVDEIQPIIDGLAFDEALLGGLLVGVPVVLIAWVVTRRRRVHQLSH